MTPKEKIEYYCSYQERSVEEVRTKLNLLGVSKQEISKIIEELIDENFLNEERFAITFAKSKLRQNHWGKIKIEFALKQRKIPANLIKIAINSIDDNEYQKILEDLISTKKNTLEKKENDEFLLRQKLLNFVISRGFDYNSVQKLIKFD